VNGVGRIVATAIHNGNELRDDVARATKLDQHSRLREEDPHTGRWADLAPTRIVVHRSRFEVDLNRPRDKAVYVTPDDAWGLDLWHATPEDEHVRESLALHDRFYADLRRVLDGVVSDHGAFVLLDLHTYNHRRDGPDANPADPALNPEVNLGTGTMDRERWAPVVERFISDLSACQVNGRQLDVRENVKFRGGYLSRWVHETYPDTGCALAIEFKKTFMDEWTSALDESMASAIGDALRATVSGLQDALDQISPPTS